ncbi:MAG: glycosyl transferase group 1 [Candidatus Brocadiaceae bacterium]|nr:glycosyl transferase group 1 [Candidatus Brocadiaceae bacterium]
MKHLIICREYPPAPGGGIGTYAFHVSRLLAEKGETVHVIGQLWKGAERMIEEKHQGKLIIHRVHYENWPTYKGGRPCLREGKGLWESNLPSQYFSWQACLLAERLIEEEGIDIIEAQEYEAPLYFLQLRRALGFGPKRCPPCIVHLHSPTELIARHNDWDVCLPDISTAKRLEDYTIAASDALLCPSRYLARQVESCYELQENTVQVIPLPIGDSPALKRDERTWEQGAICFVGRLERRKGIIEWIDAAVSVARDYPDAHFEFVGANILGTEEMGGEEFVKRRIPADLSVRFHFRGQQSREGIFQYLLSSRIAVVPSRWENYPNTCLEALCSGIPVIASREGGMAEMVVDGRTGWLADHQGCSGLAQALKRALETPPAKIAEMGYCAASEIRQICDNGKITESHLEFRRRVVQKGAIRSCDIPINLPWGKKPVSGALARRIPHDKNKNGIAIVVTCFNTGRFLEDCLKSIKLQTQKPAVVIIVDDNSTDEQTVDILNKTQRAGWQVVLKKDGDLVPVKNTGIETALGSNPDILGFVFLRAEDVLQPGFIAACESVLQRRPEIGLVSCWTQFYGTDDKVWIQPCPSFPYQWLSNEAAPFSAVRTEALIAAGKFRPVMSNGYDVWDLFNAIMAAGWVAVTIPEIMGSQWVWNDSILDASHARRRGKMRREILERFPDLITKDAESIVLLTQSYIEYSTGNEYLARKKYLMLLQKILRSPLGRGLMALRRKNNAARKRANGWVSNLFSRITG